VSLPFPDGDYELYADDDDVIGLTVAKTYPQGWAIVRTDPPHMDAFDEFEVGQFLAWCLSNRERLVALEEISQRVADGWVPSYEGLCWQHDEELWDPVDITPEQAAVLWPEDPSSGE
jgi:hypothetical protein